MVTRFIGSGAMGAVYEVVHGDLDKVFVMKVLHRDLVALEDPVRRIRSECRLLARIEHPNIVKVTDAGSTDENIPFFVMERLEGETLASRMNRCQRWVIDDVVELAIELLDGLAAAHALGIVHRDIKPSNVFLTHNSGTKILDFGIAKSFGVDAIATARGVTLGTPRYMAPEQATGESADCRADLYALGIILYELIAGEHPFSHAATPVEMLIAQAGWKAPPLNLDRLDGVSQLGVIVGKLLSKNPNARPATAALVRDWLLRISRELRSRRVQSGAQSEIHGAERKTALTRRAKLRRPLRLLRYSLLWGALAVLLTAGVAAHRISTSRANPMSKLRRVGAHSSDTVMNTAVEKLSVFALAGESTPGEPSRQAQCRTQPTVLANPNETRTAISSSGIHRILASKATAPRVEPAQLDDGAIIRSRGAGTGGNSSVRTPDGELRNLTRK